MKDKLLSIFRFVLIIVIVVCLAILGKRGYDYYNNYKNTKHIGEIVKAVNADDDQKEETFEEKEKKSMEILKKFQEENADVKGFLEIPNTYIAYPILQASDNDFYLRKGLDKNYDIAGSIFMDCQNDSEFNDDNSVIYGHFMEDLPSMFTALKEFRQEEFAQKNRTIYITTNEGLREYKIFSVYGTPADYDYRTLAFSESSEKIEYFNKLKANSEVSLENDEFKENDKIITLSTCQYDYEDQRLAVHAVRVR